MTSVTRVLRFLRFVGEIALFAMSVLLIGVAAAGGIVTLNAGTVWHARTVAFASLAMLVIGVGMLITYQSIRRPAPWDDAGGGTVTPDPQKSTRFASTLGLLRTALGGVAAFAGILCLAYGLLSGGIVWISAQVGTWQPSPADKRIFQDFWWTVPLGFLLIWSAYLLHTTRIELDQQFLDLRRRSLLQTINAYFAQAQPGAQPAVSWYEDGLYGWKAVFTRLAALPVVVFLSVGRVAGWELDAAGISHTAVMSLLIWLAMHLFIIIHELGHAAGAWMSGVAAVGIRCGRGPALVDRKMLGLRVRLRVWPSDGCCFIEHYKEAGFRIRSVAVHGGGPVAHTFAVAAVIWAARAAGPAAASALLPIALLGGVQLVFGSLLPFRIDQGARHGEQSTFLDAANVLNAGRISEVQIRWRVCVDLIQAGSRLMRSAIPEEREAGLALLESLLARYPENEILRLVLSSVAAYRADRLEAARQVGDFLALPIVRESVPADVLSHLLTARMVLLAMAGNHAQARVECQASLAEDEPVEQKLERLDRLACLPLMQGLEGYHDEALDWVDRALALRPETVTLHGTRASLLVELGRIEEAKPVLDRVRATSASPMDQGICALYLAIIARMEGRVADAEAGAAEAFRLYPQQPWMQNRWTRACAM